MEPVIVIGAMALATGAAIACRFKKGFRRAALFVAAIGFSSLCGYELYMWQSWEKTVHAPIRMDVLLFELPVAIVLAVISALAFLPKRHG